MTYARSISTDDVDALVQRLGKKLEERAVSHAEKKLREWDSPDHSTLAKISPSGSAGETYSRIELRTGLEREIDFEGRYWPEEKKEVYTAGNVREAAEFFRAIIDNDHAKLREIYDRPAQKRDPEFQRAITSASGATGAVTTGFAKMVALLNNRVAKMRSVCQVVSTSDNSISLPKVSQAPVPAFYAEGADMSGGTDTNITKLTGTPEKLGQVIKGSRELLEDSPLQLTQVLAQTIGEAIGSAEDYHVLHATPTNFTDNWGDDATASSDTWVDASETLASIASKIYELPLDAIRGAVICINSVAAATLTALTASSRQVMLPLDPAPSYLGSAEGGFGYVLGLRVLVFPTTTIPSNTAFIGDPQSYYIVDRDTLRVELDPQAFFDTDQFGLHVSRRVDGVMMQATRIRKYPPT